MKIHLTRREIGAGTRLAIQSPPENRLATVRVIIFDGLSMIEAGIPQALDTAQRNNELPPLTAFYIESIDGASKQGPTRCESLTTAAMLDRFADDFAGLLASDQADTVHGLLVGHSLGAIAALHLASRPTPLARGVVILSAALWWPGENGQLAGRDVIVAVLAAPATRVWMIAGDQEGRELLEANDSLSERLSAAGRTHARRRHPGGHEVRSRDVVAGLSYVSAHTA